MSTKSKPDERAIAGKLVSAPECIEFLFTKRSRPTLKTWRNWERRGLIGFHRIGRLKFYNPLSVRAAIEGLAEIGGAS